MRANRPTIWHTLPAALLLLLIAACSRHEERLRQLELLEARNSADSLMTDDALAESLASYFDDGGTPNERMRAHYILARTYADLGETPAALQSYLDAADAADTTAADCDWAKLSRVYGQMSALLYNQNLMHDYIEACGHSIRYAWKAQDTAQALNESLLKLAGYDRLQQPDLVIKFFDSLYRQFGQKNESTFAICAIIPAKSLLKKDSLERARQLLTLYETKSGFFDSTKTIVKGKEVYYNVKGRYYMLSGHYELAEQCFRKELYLGKDYLNQNMASYSLSLLFERMGIADSAAMYALYSYAMNDSLYAQMATEEVEKTAALYNYNRHLKRLQESKMKLAFEQNKTIFLYVLIFLLLLVLGIFIITLRMRRKRVVEKYRAKMLELSQASKELKQLRAQKSTLEELERLVELKEKVLTHVNTQKQSLEQRTIELEARALQLRNELDSYRNNHLCYVESERVMLSESAFYRWLTTTSFSRTLPDEKWTEVENLMQSYLPGFHGFISSRKIAFSQNEYRLCLLLRLHIELKVAGTLIGISQSVVSKTSHTLLAREFSVEGSGKELRKRLEAIS